MNKLENNNMIDDIFLLKRFCIPNFIFLHTYLYFFNIYSTYYNES